MSNKNQNSLKSHKEQKHTYSINIQKTNSKSKQSSQPDIQYIDLANSMKLKSGKIDISKYSKRPPLLNIKGNPHPNRFSTCEIPILINSLKYSGLTMDKMMGRNKSSSFVPAINSNTNHFVESCDISGI